MKRRLLRLGLLLVGGAIVNIAVAWGCVVSSPLSTGQASTNAADWDWLRARGWRPLANSDVYTVLNTVRHMGGMGVDYEVYFESEEVLPDGNGWSRHGSFLPGIASSAQLVCAGWPVRTLRGRAFDPVMMSRSSVHGSMLMTYQTDQIPVLQRHLGTTVAFPYFKIKGRGFGGRHMPLIPIWPGFAINTIFYAAMLWVVWFTPGMVRRRIRRRRGLCPACAYPIGTSEFCTECGGAVVGHKHLAAPSTRFTLKGDT